MQEKLLGILARVAQDETFIRREPEAGRSLRETECCPVVRRLQEGGGGVYLGSEAAFDTCRGAFFSLSLSAGPE